MFDHIYQGKRLKKQDQILGDIPFVMSGRIDYGIEGYISNPVNMFPANSLTIDIFGNTFYRNYKYSASDDVGCYWNDSIKYSKETMLFLQTVISKSLHGMFSYGKKLRASKSYKINIKLPSKNGVPDYGFMSEYINVINKLVIRDIKTSVNNKLKTY